MALLCAILFLAWVATHPSKAGIATGPSSEPRQSASPVSQSARASAAQQTVEQATATQPAAQRVLKYGSLAGEIGMVHGGGQPPVGPESFAVSRDGGILVADVVNQRVALYSSDGTYLRSLDLPGVALGDVTTDRQGRVYVYDQVRRTLQQYDTDGTLRSALSLNPVDIDTRGYFHVSGDAVYFADAAVRDVLVGSVKDGVLAPPESAAQRTTDGIHGDSGRIYSLALTADEALQVEMRDGATQSPAQSVNVPMPGIVSARYAGEDQSQRLYVQTERLLDRKIILEVLAFSPTGEFLSATRMPENDYAIWTAKLVEVRSDGTIVQFLPQQDQAKLNLFTN